MEMLKTNEMMNLTGESQTEKFAFIIKLNPARKQKKKHSKKI